MSKKSKGSAAERELISMFWKSGWAAMRAAGSGSTRFPSADIIAGNKLRLLAVECKTTKNVKKYIEKSEIEQLMCFSSILGAEPWLGIKFSGTDWLFLSRDNLKEKNSSFMISSEDAKSRGLSYDELIS